MSSSDDNASDANASDNASNASDNDVSDNTLGEMAPFFRSPTAPVRDPPTVVYVHGIAGSDYQTWNAAPNLDLEDLLCQYVDNRTNPDLYGVSHWIKFDYDAKALFSDPENFRRSLEHIALELLESIQKQDFTTFDPLVMVVHDIGGAIVELALLLAREYTRFRMITLDTFGMIRFGAPQTVDATKWEEILIDLSVVMRDEQISQMPPSTSFREAAVEFANISTQFGSIMRDFKFFNIYQDPVGETTNLYKVVVPKSLTTIQEGHERMLPRRRSHFNLCKFTHEDDQLQHIGDFVLDAMEEEFFDPYRNDYHHFLKQLTPMQGPAMLLPRWNTSNPSFEWIFSNTVFESWLSSAQASILHLHAVHGAGKTAMSQFLAWRLNEKEIEKGAAVALFSFNRDGLRTNTVDDMCCSLIAQLLLKIRRVYGALYQIYDYLPGSIDRTDIDHGSAMGEPKGWFILRTILSYTLPEQIYVIIDAIDECRGDYSKLLQAIVTHLEIATSSVKIIITSASNDQQTGDILSGHSSISLDEQDGMQVAARATIDAAIDDLVNQKPTLESFREEISDRICETRPLNVQNAHLKVKYILGSRLQSTPKSVRSVLDKVATSPLDAAFNSALDVADLDLRDWSFRALSWMVYAFRPLRVTELATALAILDGTSSGDPIDECLSRDPEADLNDALGMLISIKDGIVYFAHPQIRILAEKYVNDNLDADSGDKICHRTIARVCITYLSDARVNDALNALRDMPYQPATSLVDSTESTLQFGLVLYAAQYWPAHYRNREVILEEDTTYAIEYLQKRIEWYRLDHYPNPRVLQLPLLVELVPRMIPAYLGLSDIVSDQLNPESANYVDFMYDVLDMFTSAARGNHGKTLSLFKGHTQVNQESIFDAMIAALTARAPQAISTLLEDLKFPVVGGWKAAQLIIKAIDAGQTEILEKALNFEDEIPIQQDDFHRAIRAAASTNLVETLKKLLELPTLDKKWVSDFYAFSEVDVVKEATEDDPKGKEDDAAEETNDHAQKDTSNTYDVGPITAMAMRAAVKSGQKLTVDALSNVTEIPLDIDEFGRTTLHIACILGFTAFVPLLIKAESVDHKDDSQRTALHHAAAHGSVHVVQSLLDAGADIDASDSNGETPLALAAVFKRFNMAQLLLQKGANTQLTNKFNDSILHSAIGNGSVSIIQALINKDNLETVDSSEITPLLYAIRMRRTKIAKILIDKGANIEARAPNGATALLMAVYKRMPDLVVYLLAKGSNPRVQDDTGRTALHRAAQKGCLASLEIMLKHNTEVNAKDKMQRTPLHHGALAGSRDCVKCLLDHHAETDTADESNKTAIELASDGSGYEIGCLILKSSPNDKVDESVLKRLLHHAVAAADFEAVKLIIDRSSDTVELINSKDDSVNVDSVIYLAILSGSKAITEFIFAQGADLSLTLNDQRGPLFQAVSDKRLDLVQILLDKGADINRLHGKQRNAFHAAVLSESIEMVHLLIKHGADMNCLDPAQVPPLQLASYGVDMTRVLLENGADVHQKNGTMHAMTSIFQNYSNEETCSAVLNLYFEYGVKVDETDSRGMTAMHWAALLGHLNFAKLFLEKDKLTLEQKDKQGRSALHFAAATNKHEVVTFILDELNLQSLQDAKLGDIDGWTPLHWSSKSLSAETWTILVDRGIDISQTAANGWTAEHVANYHATSWDFGIKVLGRGISRSPSPSPSPPPRAVSPSQRSRSQSAESRGSSPRQSKDHASDRSGTPKTGGANDMPVELIEDATNNERVDDAVYLVRKIGEGKAEANTKITNHNAERDLSGSDDAEIEHASDEEPGNEYGDANSDHDAQSKRSVPRSRRSRSRSIELDNQSARARSRSAGSGSQVTRSRSPTSRSVSRSLRSLRTRSVNSVASDTFDLETGLPKFAAYRRNRTCAHCLTEIFGPSWTCETHDTFYYLCFKCGWHKKEQHDPTHKWTSDIKKKEYLPAQAGGVLTKEQIEIEDGEKKDEEESKPSENEGKKSKDKETKSSKSTSDKSSMAKEKGTHGKRYKISTRPKYKDERKGSVRSVEFENENENENDSEDSNAENESGVEDSSPSESDVVVTGRRGRKRQ